MPAIRLVPFVLVIGGAVGGMVAAFGATDAEAHAAAVMSAEPAAAPVPMVAPAPIGAAADGGAADEGGTTIPAEACTLEFTFTPGVWAPRLGGKSRLGGQVGAEKLSFEDDFNLDGSEIVFAGDFSLTIDDEWLVDVSGFTFSTHSGQETFADPATPFGDVTLNPGDSFSSSIDIDSFAVDGGYWLWKPIHTDRPNSTLTQTDLRFAPQLGVRYISIDQKLTDATTGLGDHGSGDWIAPYIGLDLRMRTRLKDSFPLIRTLEIEGEIAAGPAFGLGSSGDVGGMVQLKAIITAYFTDNVGVSFGYRLLGLDGESDDYEASNMTLEGLFAGVAIRF